MCRRAYEDVSENDREVMFLKDYSNAVWEILSQQNYIQTDKYCDAKVNTVYHYTSPEGLMGIFPDEKNAKLWFTKYDSLNDTSERTNTIEYLYQYCDRRVSENRLSQIFADTIKSLKLSDYQLITLPGKGAIELEHNGVIDEYTDTRYVPCDTYLCCFSKHPDLLPMWNYYSKSQHYEGYSIGFFSSLFQRSASFEKGYFIDLKKVLYRNSEKDELFDAIILPFNNLFAENVSDREDITQIIQGKINELQFVFKNECFRHEEEIRAILHIPRESLGSDGKEKSNNFTVNYRNSHGYIVPYIEYEVAKIAVNGITVAPLLQSDLAINNLRELMQQRGCGNIWIEPSVVPIRF